MAGEGLDELNRSEMQLAQLNLDQSLEQARGLRGLLPVVVFAPAGGEA